MISRTNASSLLVATIIAGLTITSLAAAQEAGPGVVDPGHPRVNEVNAREANQQRRIAQGEKSGRLTPAEAAKVQSREANIQSHEAADMAAHNGHLTKREQRNLNRRENHASKAIYRKKHN
jgi:hypothetical protein